MSNQLLVRYKLTKSSVRMQVCEFVFAWAYMNMKKSAKSNPSNFLAKIVWARGRARVGQEG